MHEFGDPQPVARSHWLDVKIARGDVAYEAHLCAGAEPCADQVRDLGDYEGWHDQRTRMGSQQFQAGCVVPVAGINVCIQGASVDDQRDDGTSLARISSMRSETSARPLRPAAAAPSRRRGPRWLSIASRVSSEMVMPRRLAS